MKFLKSLSSFQFKHSNYIIGIALIVTLFLSLGISNISMQSNLDEMYPQDLEIFKIADKIEDNFGGQDSSIILLRIEDVESGDIYDIRDPEALQFMVALESKLSDEDLVESVSSIGSLFTEETIPETLDESVAIFSNTAGVSDYFSKDYSSTVIMISSDLGGGEEKIKELEDLIDDAIDEISKPSGLKIYITGTPQIRSMILDLLVHDAVFTLSLAAAIIFILLVIMEKSFTKALLIFFPLILGISWTLGAMGWLEIELSMATVGIGAMILGLGVEYGVFIVSRYSEERENKSSEKSLEIVVKEVGSSVLGSGMTTVTGFLALTLSVMPMLQDLGLSLALGIAFSLIAAVFVNPALIILEEKYEHWKTQKTHDRILEKKKLHKTREVLDEKDS